MPEDVLNPDYWRNRLINECNGEPHRAMFKGSIDQLRVLEEPIKLQLRKELKRTDSVLDAGCGYGRLLTLMPPKWEGDYLGIDISPDFIQLAKLLHGKRRFQVGDLLDLSNIKERFDVGVVIWIKGMLESNLGTKVGTPIWLEMEKQLRTVCNRLIVMY